MSIIVLHHSPTQFGEQAAKNSWTEWQQLEMLTAGSESLAITVVTMVPLTAFGATMPRYSDWLKTGGKSFMSWRVREREGDCSDALALLTHSSAFVFQPPPERQHVSH